PQHAEHARHRDPHDAARRWHRARRHVRARGVDDGGQRGGEKARRRGAHGAVRGDAERKSTIVNLRSTIYAVHSVASVSYNRGSTRRKTDPPGCGTLDAKRTPSAAPIPGSRYVESSILFTTSCAVTPDRRS